MGRSRGVRFFSTPKLVLVLAWMIPPHFELLMALIVARRTTLYVHTYFLIHRIYSPKNVPKEGQLSFVITENLHAELIIGSQWITKVGTRVLILALIRRKLLSEQFKVKC